ncbi:MAG: hypothetical protein R3A52_05400 [Polyangiales bacterium]
MAAMVAVIAACAAPRWRSFHSASLPRPTLRRRSITRTTSSTVSEAATIRP